MPNPAKIEPVPVTTTQGYTLKPEQLNRISDFIDAVQIKNRPSAVIVIDPANFAAVATKMTGGAPTRTAFTIGDRIYLNGSTLSSDNGAAQDLGHSGQKSRLAELALSHELAHMQDTRPRPWQEAHDSIYNSEGQKIFQQWQQAVDAQQKRAAQAYQQMREQSMVKAPQELQDRLPSSSINTTLIAPNEMENSAPLSPRVQNIMAQQPLRSYVQRVIAQQPVSSLRMADRMKLQPPETGK